MRILACSSMFVVLLILAGCTLHEAGPAERLGRHIDDLSADISDLSKEDARKADEQERIRRERAASMKNEDVSDYYRRPAPADDSGTTSSDSTGSSRTNDGFSSRPSRSKSGSNDYRY